MDRSLAGRTGIGRLFDPSPRRARRTGRARTHRAGLARERARRFYAQLQPVWSPFARAVDLVRAGCSYVWHHRRLVLVRADELAHHAEPAGRYHGARLGLDVTSDQPEQRGLARAVRADQRRRYSIADPEAHVVKEGPSVRQHVADVRDLNMPGGSHGRTLASEPRPHNVISRRPEAACRRSVSRRPSSRSSSR